MNVGHYLYIFFKGKGIDIKQEVHNTCVHTVLPSAYFTVKTIQSSVCLYNCL